MKNFFVSYTGVDQSWAEWIAWHLEAAGYTTIIQAWDFRPGTIFVLAMQWAAEAERTIAVLSPDYPASRFTQPEWAAAFAQDPTGEQGLLVPVRVRECDMRGLLSQIVYIDLVGRDEDTAKKTLLDGVSPRRAKPTTPPKLPGDMPTQSAAQPHFPGGKELSPQEQVRLQFFLGCLFRATEEAFLQHRDGFLEDEYWNKRGNLMLNYLRYPGMFEAWQDRFRSTYHSAFTEWVESQFPRDAN